MANLGKLIQNFRKFSQSLKPGKSIHTNFLFNFCSISGHYSDLLLENSSVFFVSTYLGFFKYRDMSWTDFWKTGPYLDEFSINLSVSRPEFFEYHFTAKCSILDEFSKNRSSSCPGNLPIIIIDASQTSSWDFKYNNCLFYRLHLVVNNATDWKYYFY